MERSLTARRVAAALVAAVLVLGAGTIGFHRILHEDWLEAFYRSVVTSSLAGLDSVPREGAGLVLSIVLVFAGVTIFAFAGAMIVEAIARGVLAGAWAERRRRRAIDKLHDHTIICGYGRVGRWIAEAFRRAGAPFIVVDIRPEALEAGQEAGDLARGERDRGRRPRCGRDRARSGADRGPRLGHRQPLHRAVRAGGPPRPADRRARLRRGRRAEAAAGGRRPGRHALLDCGPGDGGPRAQAAGGRLSQRGRVGRGAGPALRSDRGPARLAHGGQVAPRAEHPRAHRSVDPRALEAGRRVPHPPVPGRGPGGGDVLIGVGTGEEIQALEDFFAPSPAGVS